MNLNKNSLFSLIILLLSIPFCMATTIGGVGADYANLKLAVLAINNGSLTGNIVLQITGNTTEPSACTINESGVGAANYSHITIYPTVACTINGNFNSGVIVLNGADSVTIDGRINQSGTSKDLTIINESQGVASSTIIFQNSATNNLVQFTNIKGATTSPDLGVVSFLSPGTGGGTGNDFNTITHCDITGTSNTPRYCIYGNGTQVSGSDFNDHIDISYNRIYDFYYTSATPGVTSAGIQIAGFASDWEIHHNSIYQTQNRTAGWLFFMFIATTGGAMNISYNIIGGMDEFGNGQYDGDKTQILIFSASTVVQSLITFNTIRGIKANFNSVTYSQAIKFTGKIHFNYNTNGGADINNGIVHKSTTSIAYYIQGADSSIFDHNSFENFSSSSQEMQAVISNALKVNHNVFKNLNTGNVVSGSDTVTNCVFRNTKSNCISGAVYVGNNNIRGTSYDTGANHYVISGTTIENNVVINIQGSSSKTTIFNGSNVFNNFAFVDTTISGNIIGIEPNSFYNYVNNNIIVLKYSSSTDVYDIARGIFIDPSSSNAIYNIYHNTIFIEGKFYSTIPSQRSSCIDKTSTVFCTLNMMNNILEINNTGGAGNLFCYNGRLTQYLNIDYNDYYTNGNNAYIAVNSTNNQLYSTLLSWQAITAQEANAVALDPVFVNLNQANAAGFIPQEILPGSYIASVPNDYFNNIRPATPTIGAIENGACAPIQLNSTINACQNYTLGNQTFTTSGTYTVTIDGIGSCDTIYTLNLTIENLAIAPTISASGATTFCQGGSVLLSGNNNGVWNNNSNLSSISVASAGDYFVLASNTCGTDTSNIITISIDPLPQPSAITALGSIVFCDGDSVILNGNTGGVWNTNQTSSNLTVYTTGSYYVTNQNNCGSVNSNIIDVIANPLPNSNVSLSGITLIASNTTASYQWIDCNSLTNIAGATNQNYTPINNGDYAVIVTQNACADTSICTNVIVTEVLINTSNVEINISPNPVKDIVYLSKINGIMKASIFNALGQIVLSQTISKVEESINMSEFNKGIYFLQLSSQNQSIKTFKLVKD
jgi:hypothetical protein